MLHVHVFLVAPLCAGHVAQADINGPQLDAMIDIAVGAARNSLGDEWAGTDVGRSMYDMIDEGKGENVVQTMTPEFTQLLTD